MIPLLSVEYEPWWAQRLFHRSTARIRVIVAGRQTGKSLAAAREVVKIMCLRPGTVSVLLMPIVKSTEGPLRHLRAALVAALGPEGGRWTWRSQAATFRVWNGALLHVRTCDTDADQGVPVRGLTVDGVLWVDEAAFVPRSAWDYARFTLAAVADPRTIVTTTPCGRGWVHDEWIAGQPGPKRSQETESFRFRSTQSPYCNAAFIEDLKHKLGASRAMQELDAVFLGEGGSVFTTAEIDRLLLPASLPIRGSQRTLGLDLAKDRDFIVATLMNELGEAWIVWRARHVKWPDAEARLVQIANEHQALVVVDTSGGQGSAMGDYLERALGKARVLGFKTGNKLAKASMIETLQSAIQNDRIKLCPGEYLEIARNEFLFFEGHRRMVGGVEVWSYQGPRSEKAGTSETGEGEDHDDVVISLGLANWGREHGWSPDPLRGDFSGFAAGTELARSVAAADDTSDLGDWAP